MTVSLIRERENKLRCLVSQLQSIKNPKIRFVAKVVGTIVSSFPAVKYAPLHYRSIEKVKSEALDFSKGNFEAKCFLSPEPKVELTWWKTASLTNWIHRPPISIEIETDACKGNPS